MTEVVKPKLPHADCAKCPLRRRALVPGYGPPPDKCKAVIVGEAPGYNEAKTGFPFVGQSGALLRSMLHHVGLNGGAGLDLDEKGRPSTPPTCDNGEVYYTNCGACHPPGNKLPFGVPKKCSNRLAAELKPYWDAGVPIAALGVVPGEILIGRSEKSLRGKWYKDGRVLCTWHPAHILRMGMKRGRFSELMMDLRRLARGGPMEIPYPSYIVVQDEYELRVMIEYVLSLSPAGVCFDLETDQLMWWKHKILAAGFAYDVDKAFVIPEELIYEESTSRLLSEFFTSGLHFVGHNIKFDLRYAIHQMHVTPPHSECIEDTLIAHHALDESMSHGLKPLLNNYFDIGDYEGHLVQRYLKTKGDFYSKVPRRFLYEYNALDVCYTLRLWCKLARELLDDDMFERPYKFPMMASQPMLVDMELHGMFVDVEKLEWVSEELGKGRELLQSELEQTCKIRFNPNSFKQVGKIMYDKYHMPIVVGRGFKARSTCQQARRMILEKIDRESEAGKWLIKFGQLKSIVKLKSSYCDNVWRYLDEEGKVHPDGLIYGTESGRMSFRDPPIQTIPRPGTGSALGDAWGQHIRGYYIAPEGYKMVEVDISQAEMRVACALSGEPFLHDLYKRGADLHTMVALEMYGKNYTKDQRNACKKFNFAYLYGGTEHSFALEQGMNVSLARDFVRRYKEIMPVLTAWKESMMEELQREGYVSTRTGRRRRFPLITDDNYDEARKAAVVVPVQGMASEITLITAIKTWEWLQSTGLWPDVAVLVAIIHDSVMLIVEDGFVSYVTAKVMDIMEGVGLEWVPEVPWKIDADVGQDWGHLKDISEWPEFALSATKK